MRKLDHFFHSFFDLNSFHFTNLLCLYLCFCFQRTSNQIFSNTISRRKRWKQKASVISKVKNNIPTFPRFSVVNFQLEFFFRFNFQSNKTFLFYFKWGFDGMSFWCQYFVSTWTFIESSLSIALLFTIAFFCFYCNHYSSKMMTSFFRAMRAFVSADKKRFNLGGFDLDLTYITDRIIGMCHSFLENQLPF
jgi:hypothetical protein